jgi:hypothetical protein
MRRVDALLILLALTILLAPPLTRIHLHRSHSCHQVTRKVEHRSSYLRCD